MSDDSDAHARALLTSATEAVLRTLQASGVLLAQGAIVCFCAVETIYDLLPDEEKPVVLSAARELVGRLAALGN